MAMLSPVVVLDAGKRGEEHFEFNRGVLAALVQAGRSVTFQAFASMAAAHGHVAGVQVAPYSFWGAEERLRPRWRNAFTKLISVGLAVRALWHSRRSPLVVAYAAPISHVVLAVLARFRRAPLTVYLHAEVEFLHRTGRPAMLGERLMLAALRAAPSHLTYLVLTEAAASELGKSGATRARVAFCPHPISTHVLDRSLNGDEGRSGAFSMIKSAADVDVVRRLLLALPEAVSGCGFNGDGVISVQGASAEELVATRRFLSRQQLETELASARFFLFPAAENAYAYTASGLACAAASAGAHVVGLSNGFMNSYAKLYPQTFHVLEVGMNAARSKPTESAPLGQPATDNLAEVARCILDHKPAQSQSPR